MVSRFSCGPAALSSAPDSNSLQRAATARIWRAGFHLVVSARGLADSAFLSFPALTCWALTVRCSLPSFRDAGSQCLISHVRCFDVMSLIAVACPQSESELACMLCELESRGIYAFAQGAGFGSLWPGVQIPSYNARRIMVSSADLSAAHDALAPFTHPTGPRSSYQWPGFHHLLRMIVELGLLGWCVPADSHRNKSKAPEHADKSMQPTAHDAG